MPKKFKVIFTEVSTRSFQVEAETPAEAVGRSIIIRSDGDDDGEFEYQEICDIEVMELI